jgi:hypothetical protein
MKQIPEASGAGAGSRDHRRCWARGVPSVGGHAPRSHGGLSVQGDRREHRRAGGLVSCGPTCLAAEGSGTALTREPPRPVDR